MRMSLQCSARGLYDGIVDAGREHELLTLKMIVKIVGRYGLDSVAFSFNGGKDSTVLLHFLRAAIAYKCGLDKPLHNMTTVYFYDKNEFPEVTDFMEDAAQRYGFKIRILHGSFKSALTEWLVEQPVKAIFMGQRVVDPGAKHLVEETPSDKGWPSFVRINPILNWSYAQVWDFILRNNLKFCPLYDQGYTSLGNKLDTIKNPALRRRQQRRQNAQPSHCTIRKDRDQVGPDPDFFPAHMLQDHSLERAGRGNDIVSRTNIEQTEKAKQAS